jgi:nickel/cobalt transporter (NiCoT) family protein
VVFALGVLVAVGAKIASNMVTADSQAHRTLSLVGTLVSGIFLIAIGLINLMALISIVKVWRRARGDGLDELALEQALDTRGFMIRILRPLMRRITKQGQMYPVGFLFGLGFDTASEVAVLVLVGAGVATGLPWYAVLVLPLLFASGMSLFDTLDGIFMQSAYQWAFVRPVRKIYYNLTTTGLSVAVALLIGAIETIAVLNDRLRLTDPVSTFIAQINLDAVGYVIVALFIMVLAGSALYWRMSRVEERWAAALRSRQSL